MKVKAVTKYVYKGKEYNSLKDLQNEAEDIISNASNLLSDAENLFCNDVWLWKSDMNDKNE